MFAVVCGGYGLYGLSVIDAGMTDVERSDGRGFAMFLPFLGAIGAALSVVSWLLRGKIRLPKE